MMVRFRADILFTPVGAQLGLPTWCVQNAAQIESMSFHLHPGTPREERRFNRVDPEEPRRWHANFFVPDTPTNRANIDALHDLVASQFTHFERGVMDAHVCRHDETPPRPCDKPYRRAVWP